MFLVAGMKTARSFARIANIAIVVTIGMNLLVPLKSPIMPH
jgi:hypothetical protein